jgi:hypothetical protein
VSVDKRDRRWLRALVVIGVGVGSMAAISSVSAQTRSDRTSIQGWKLPGVTNALAAAATVRPPGEVLGGFTSQGWPVVIAISKDGKRINAIGIGLDMSCTSGLNYGLRDFGSSIRLGPRGKIHLTAVIPPSPGSGVSLTGGSDSLTGTLNRQRLTFSGVWELILMFKDSTGQVDKCDSGRVTFAARL